MFKLFTICKKNTTRLEQHIEALHGLHTSVIAERVLTQPHLFVEAQQDSSALLVYHIQRMLGHDNQLQINHANAFNYLPKLKYSNRLHNLIQFVDDESTIGDINLFNVNDPYIKIGIVMEACKDGSSLVLNFQDDQLTYIYVQLANVVTIRRFYHGTL